MRESIRYELLHGGLAGLGRLCGNDDVNRTVPQFDRHQLLQAGRLRPPTVENWGHRRCAGGKSGKITGLVIGVGGSLGAGEKDMIVPLTAVKSEKRNDKWYLTMDEPNDNLNSAPGFKYNGTTTTWEPEKK